MNAIRNNDPSALGFEEWVSLWNEWGEKDQHCIVCKRKDVELLESILPANDEDRRKKWTTLYYCQDCLKERHVLM